MTRTNTLTTCFDPQTCPKCGSKHDAATSMLGKHKMKPGDITVCLYCGCIGKFDDSGALLEISIFEIPKSLFTVILRLHDAVVKQIEERRAAGIKLKGEK
jgi:hypothetical protein